MKKPNLAYILLLTPFALWAQTDESAPSNPAAPEVAVLAESSGDTATAQDENALPTVVEIPDAPIEGASIDVEAPEIPEAKAVLPGETEVVLDLPGQDDAGSASMATEEAISVDFPDEDVRTILRNVADLFDLNLVIPETLQGRTSIKLRNVTWRQVYEVVLDPLGYTFVEDRNIIRIKSVDELTTEPVDTRVFVINYARAAELKESLAPLVDTAAGGRVQVDARSNALVITERPSRMNKIQEIIERLDKATDQVMIESKFVEVRTTDGKDLGVDWSSLGADDGISVGVGDFLSKLTNSQLGFDATTALDSLGRPVVAQGELTQNPLDSAVFSADSFSAILRALQTKNDVKLVSNPTVVTMDNEKAQIKISREFPQPEFTFNSETGMRQFNGLGEPIDVGITLEVTPTVSAAGFINLDIFPEVSSTSEDRTIEGTDFPIRDVRTARTRIMIKDGYTLALGGLVSSETREDESRVPLLGSLPGVGRMFRNNSESVVETNLIIFITAKTLNPDGTDYRDIVDPRVIDRMGITPSMIPGYEVPADQVELMNKLSEYRENDLKEKSLEEANQEITSIEEAKLKEEEQEQIKVQLEEKAKQKRRSTERL